MKLDVQPGKYVVAVSGGVDSVALLDMLTRLPALQLVVAHLDHGIRPDSNLDAELVERLAAQHELPFAAERAELGPQASEATARQARYAFLRRVQAEHGAQAIIMAHHQDDVMETALLNLARGTGRRGLTSLRSTDGIVRPLLYMPKAELVQYANQHHLSWREDSTNRDERYARNYIRNRLQANQNADARQRLLALITQARAVNDQLDTGLMQLLATRSGLPRQWFARLPHDLSTEVMTTWLRQQGLADFDRATITRLTVQAKTKPIGKKLDVRHGHQLHITKESLALRPPER